jgi:hypothetical protein
VQEPDRLEPLPVRNPTEWAALAAKHGGLR